MNSLLSFFSRANRWPISKCQFALWAALAHTIIFNGALCTYLFTSLDIFSLSGLSIAASVFVIVWLANVLFFSIGVIVAPPLLILFLILTAVINAIALYYMFTYQVVLDKSMINNVFNTKPSEAFELLSPTLLIYGLLLGALPIASLLKFKILPATRWRVVGQLLVVSCLSSSFIYANASSWLWIDKHAKLLGGKILPWSYVGNTIRHLSAGSVTIEDQVLLPSATFLNNEKTVVVLIIGETARSHNFSLYDYSRQTNPLLEKRDLLILNKTTSCTTYTTASVACMLSSDIDTANIEPLPNYLTRIGADVIWRTNNWGEPPMAVSEYQKGADLVSKCQGDGCQFDENLLTGLAERIKSSDKDKVFVVLHTKGSHGPSYYAKYPSQFEKFTPVCRSEQLNDCTQQALINAYDNTILYTDYFINEAISRLELLTNIPSMLVYVSDHGESLGENGLYLHGTPYTFAPKYQKEIPFIIWRSNAMKARELVQNSAINQQGEFSHSNIFHTIIGAFKTNSPSYNKQLDILAL